MELLERIDNRVKNTLSEKRYFHSVCTMNRMEILAKIYNIDSKEYDVVKWSKLENVRYFYDFFKEHEAEFD